MERKKKFFQLRITEEQDELLGWLSYKEKVSKSALIRQMLDEYGLKDAPPEKLEARIDGMRKELAEKRQELERLNKELELKKEAEPVKEAKFEELFESAVQLVVSAVKRGKENEVADGNSAHIRSFGFKCSKQDLLDEAYRRVGKNGLDKG